MTEYQSVHTHGDALIHKCESKRIFAALGAISVPYRRQFPKVGQVRFA